MALGLRVLKILIVSPGSLHNGNTRSAIRWASELSALGHEVRITSEWEDENVDLLVALNAEKSHHAVAQCHNHGQTPVVVALTGTDLYPSLSPNSLSSLQMANLIVVYQAKALAHLPEHHQTKARVIPLSAPDHPALRESNQRSGNDFLVCVVGHLRAVKDPMRTARASRLLPPASRIRILHAGSILEERFAAEVAREEAENPRYKWLGPLETEEALRLIASSNLFALTSLQEGGGCAMNEAAAAQTPILASRNDASTSLLGEDYPGLFPFGDTETLSALLYQCESEPHFCSQLLKNATNHLRNYRSASSNGSWSNILEELFPSAST
ncbi:MAG: glycosyl transferase family 1 [Roseibacillus sp.]|nr:glycosyl transferase family 1 [Roseibacillus sp.]